MALQPCLETLNIYVKKIIKGKGSFFVIGKCQIQFIICNIHCLTLCRAYTSVLLFIQLLTIGIYAVGTIMTNRVGFSKMAIMKKHKDIQRGKTMISTTATIPCMSCIGWWDNRAVHFLATGIDCCVNQSVLRRIRGTGKPFYI